MRDPLDILPFRFLGPEARDLLRARLQRDEWAAGDTIVHQGTAGDFRLFLLTEGAVIARNAERPDSSQNLIEAGHFFGERPALFNTARDVEIVAATDVVACWFDGRELLPLFDSEPAFAHAMAFVVRDKHGMFADVDHFVAEVRLGASRGYLVIAKLLRHYKPLTPALHRGIKDADVDLGALSYAIRRLPTNVTRTFVWFAADELPDRYTAARAQFLDTTADARRRVTLEMLPGKSMLTLRDGISDLLDLVTCLCIYAVEARKLRRRLRNRTILSDLHGPEAEVTLQRVLSPAERSTLESLWPGDVAQRLLEICLHHEDITVHTYRRTNNYNSAHAELWTHQIADATRELLGTEPYALPDDFPVHIVSSNTHSVTNCLSPWIPENEAALLAWGQAHAPAIYDATWHDPNDRLVALVRPFLEAHPEHREAKTTRDRALRIQLDETAFTGIRVQLFRMDGLQGLAVDPCLPEPSRAGLIVNIDYAFGQQAEPIIGNLVHLFGKRIRSVNVLGKAGGLIGNRGDVLIADTFVNQREDVVLTTRTQLDVERLQQRLPDRKVHRGPVLTVLGTVLQNDRLLHYYKNLWGCIGLEMEGSYYCRQVLECRELGMLRDDVTLRFAYYTSDLPLAHEHTLAGRMAIEEGIPPLYAITREVLSAVLEDRG